MQAGNAFYQTIDDLPPILPILAQPHLVLLPNGFVPVTLEDAAMIQMVNDAFRGNRLIGVAQPRLVDHHERSVDAANMPFYKIGCVGRITNYSEIGDGSLLISLQGICRFCLKEPIKTLVPYPVYCVEMFDGDLRDGAGQEAIDRDVFLNVFRAFLDINNMQADWDTILEAPDETLVNALAIIAPFDMTEKQALLEAHDLKLRSETLIALAERYMMRQVSGRSPSLQ